jgi:hypothetical protein
VVEALVMLTAFGVIPQTQTKGGAIATLCLEEPLGGGGAGGGSSIIGIPVGKSGFQNVRNGTDGSHQRQLQDARQTLQLQFASMQNLCFANDLLCPSHHTPIFLHNIHTFRPTSSNILHFILAVLTGFTFKGASGTSVEPDSSNFLI